MDVTFGTRLRLQRERQHVTLTAIADETKINWQQGLDWHAGHPPEEARRGCNDEQASDYGWADTGMLKEMSLVPGAQ